MKLTVQEFAFLIAECMNKDEAAMESARKGLTEKYSQEDINRVCNGVLKAFFCNNTEELEMYSFKLRGYEEMCSSVKDWDPKKITPVVGNDLYRFRLPKEDSQK
jgi:hypothetical protein